MQKKRKKKKAARGIRTVCAYTLARSIHMSDVKTHSLLEGADTQTSEGARSAQSARMSQLFVSSSVRLRRKLDRAGVVCDSGLLVSWRCFGAGGGCDVLRAAGLARLHGR